MTPVATIKLARHQSVVIWLCVTHSLIQMKDIRIPVTNDEHERLTDAKDDRTWREALFEEFGVERDE